MLATLPIQASIGSDDGGVRVGTRSPGANATSAYGRIRFVAPAHHCAVQRNRPARR